MADGRLAEVLGDRADGIGDLRHGATVPRRSGHPNRGAGVPGSRRAAVDELDRTAAARLRDVGQRYTAGRAALVEVLAASTIR